MDPDLTPAASPRYAGFWVRVGAALIDTVVLGFLLGLIVRLLGWQLIPPELFSGDLAAASAASAGADPVWLIELLLVALVIAFWLTKRGTPGKLLLGLEVVDADTLGTLKVGQAVGRYIGYFLSTLPFFLGLIWVGLDKRKQGWHDKLAGTLVIHKAKAP